MLPLRGVALKFTIVEDVGGCWWLLVVQVAVSVSPEVARGWISREAAATKTTGV